MTTIHLAGHSYQFYLSRVPAKQLLSLVLLPIHSDDQREQNWAKRLYELHELLDGHFYPLQKELLFKPVFPGSPDLLELNIGTGDLPLEAASVLLRKELIQFKSMSKIYSLG